jgi:hypothetical protein
MTNLHSPRAAVKDSDGVRRPRAMSGLCRARRNSASGVVRPSPTRGKPTTPPPSTSSNAHHKLGNGTLAGESAASPEPRPDSDWLMVTHHGARRQSLRRRVPRPSSHLTQTSTDIGYGFSQVQPMSAVQPSDWLNTVWPQHTANGHPIPGCSRRRQPRLPCRSRRCQC